jgi:putative membrane protein
MRNAGNVLVALIALAHVYFMILEMFLWQSPEFGLRIFDMTPEQAATSQTLALNQGLYNGFLAAGLLWSAFVLRDERHRVRNLSFFLGFVVIAGIVGGLTASGTIFLVQGLPALIALGVVRAARLQAA